MVLTVPREAVLDSGTEKLVYVVRDNGVFQQQPIQAGTPLKDRYPVLQRPEGRRQGGHQWRVSRGLTDTFDRRIDRNVRWLEVLHRNASTRHLRRPTGRDFKFTFRIDPDPPQGAKENTIHVTLTDPSGKPVSDAQVRLTFIMPAMPAMNMAEMRNTAELKWTGSEYTGPIQIMMAGGWNVAIEARRGNELLATAQAHVNAR